MHNAPLVQYPVGRFAWGFVACALLGTAGLLLAGGLFYFDHINADRAVLSVSPVFVVAALWTLSGARRTVPAWLVWDGHAWQCWNDDEGQELSPVVSLSVQADFQHVLLLHVACRANAGSAIRPKWLWLYKGFAPAKWHGLRCAVYSRLN